MTLDKPFYPEKSDDALEWAVDREFELRAERYEFLRNGGLVGAIQRATGRMESLTLTLRGLGDSCMRS